MIFEQNLSMLFSDLNIPEVFIGKHNFFERSNGEISLPYLHKNKQ